VRLKHGKLRSIRVSPKRWKTQTPMRTPGTSWRRGFCGRINRWSILSLASWRPKARLKATLWGSGWTVMPVRSILTHWKQLRRT